MATWRFGDSPEDGATWLQDPSLTFIYVDFETLSLDGGKEWRRVMVVTKSWIAQQLTEVGEAGALSVALPSMIVLRDAEGEELRRAVDALVARGGLDDYSSRLETSEALP